METPIEVLDLNKVRVFRAIKIEGPEWNHFFGYVHYKRTLTRDYNAATIDILDDLIFEAVKSLYSNSRRSHGINILFKGEYEDYVKSITGGTTVFITLRLTPEIPVDDLSALRGRTFTEYLPKFKFEVQLSPQSERLESILVFGMARFPFNQITSIPTLLKTIDFN